MVTLINWLVFFFRCTPRRAHCAIKELRHLATFGQQRGRRGKAAFFYSRVGKVFLLILFVDFVIGRGGEQMA